MVRIIVLFALFAIASAQLIKIPMTKKQYHVLSTDNIRVERNHLMKKHHTTIKDEVQDASCVVNMDRTINNRFYAQVAVGTPSQILNTVFDTSAYIAYISNSKNCSTCLGFNIDASTTAQIINSNTSTVVEYSDASTDSDDYDYSSEMVNTMFVEDVFNIGGVDVDVNFALNKILYDNVDMVFGLGLPNRGFLLPPLYYMFQQQELPDSQFAIYYDINNDTDFGGHLMLGSVDSSILTNLVIDSYKNYNNGLAVVIDSMEINGIVTATDTTAIIESGANFIGVPLLTFIRINQQIDGIVDDEGNYFVDCDKVDSLPDISVKIFGAVFTMAPENYILHVSDGLTACMSAFTYLNSDVFFLGQPFLTNVVTVVNFKQETIGFSQLNVTALPEIL